MRFADRDEAGRHLAHALEGYRGEKVVVLGIPRGGVPVAARVASDLNVPLDVIVVRKLGLPGQPELAMGAVGEDGVLVVNEDVVRRSGVSAVAFAAVESQERREVLQRARRFRGRRSRVPLDGQIAIIVDDGLATGATARAACQVARAHGAAQVVLAVPVGAADTVAALHEVVDEVVCLQAPEPFWAVGQGYVDFGQVADAEVSRLLGALA